MSQGGGRHKWRLAGLVGAVVVGLALLLGGVLWAVNDLAERDAQLERLIERTNELAREGDQRDRRQCAKDERLHADDVQRLRDTYAYLEELPREERGTFLTARIVASLPTLEKTARLDRADPSCDRPGYGLSEPDPKLPKRRDFSYLLER